MSIFLAFLSPSFRGRSRLSRVGVSKAVLHFVVVLRLCTSVPAVIFRASHLSFLFTPAGQSPIVVCKFKLIRFFCVSHNSVVLVTNNESPFPIGRNLDSPLLLHFALYTAAVLVIRCSSVNNLLYRIELAEGVTWRSTVIPSVIC